MGSLKVKNSGSGDGQDQLKTGLSPSPGPHFLQVEVEQGEFRKHVEADYKRISKAPKDHGGAQRHLMRVSEPKKTGARAAHGCVALPEPISHSKSLPSLVRV